MGMYVLFCDDLGYLSVDSVFCRKKISFVSCVFQAKTWVTYQGAYNVALKLWKLTRDPLPLRICKYDFLNFKFLENGNLLDFDLLSNGGEK